MQVSRDIPEPHQWPDYSRDVSQPLPVQDSQGGVDSRPLEPSTPSWFYCPSLGWLFPFLFALSVLSGMIATPVKQLEIEIICKIFLRENGMPSHGGDYQSQCSTPEIQALVALVFSRVGSINSFTAIFTLGFYSSLSDRLGRKFLFYMMIIPPIFSLLLMIYMGSPHSKLGLHMLYFDAIFSGVTGGDSLTEPALISYIVDCTEKSKLSVVLGYGLVVVSLGTLVGHPLGGYITMHTGDNRVALIIAAGAMFVMIFYAIAMPESLPREQRSKLEAGLLSEFKTTFSAKSLYSTILGPLLIFLPGRIEIVLNGGLSASRYILLQLVVFTTILRVAAIGIDTVFYPFTNLVFGWTAVENSAYFTFNAAGNLLLFLGIFPALQYIYKHIMEKSPLERTIDEGQDMQANDTNSRYTGHRGDGEAEISETTPILERTANIKPQSSSDQGNDDDMQYSTRKDMMFMLIGTILFALGYMIVSVFMTGPAMFVSCGILSLASITDVSFQSLFTSYIPVQERGKAIGGISVVGAISSTVGPLLFGWLFAQTSAKKPEAVYQLSSGLSFVAVVIAGMIIERARRGRRKH